MSGLQVEKERVVQELLLLLESYEDNIREKAAWILASLQLKEERIIDGLLLLLQDSHANVREAAVTSLGILQVKDIRVIDQMKQLLFNDSWDIKRAVAKALHVIQVNDEKLILHLVHDLENHSGNAWKCAATALGVLQVNTDNVIQRLLEVLKHNNCKHINWSMHMVAARSLGRLQVNDGRIIAALLNMLDNEDPTYRKTAILALDDSQVSNEQIIQKLQETLTDKDSEIRVMAAISLSKLKIITESTIQVLLTSLKRRDGSAIDAAKTLGMLQLRDARIVQGLLNTILVPTAWGISTLEVSAAQSLYALKVNDEAVISALLEALENNKLPLQQELAAMTLGELRVKDARVIHGLLNTLGKNWSLRQAAAKALVSCYQQLEDALKPQFDELKRLQEEMHSPTPVYETQQLPSVDETIRPANITIPVDDQTTAPTVVTIHRDFAVQPSPSLKIHARSLQEVEIADGVINPPLGAEINQIGMPSSYQELIQYMLNPECTIDNRTTRTSELVFNEGITLDEIHMNALETLLEQSEYDVCLSAGHFYFEKNKVYLELVGGSLKYSVIDLTNTVQRGRIPNAALNYQLTAPLTLDQLTSIPDILEIIANEGHIRPQIKTLTLNNVKFTKAYRILEKKISDEDQTVKVKPNAFHVRCHYDLIEYFVINPYGEKSIGTINRSVLINMGLKLNEIEVISKKDVESIVSAIFELTAKKGHTFPENRTKGYQTFLNILNNQRLLPQLESLDLQGCDLWDDNDIKYLYPILSERASFQHLNLDNNHITQTGLLKLLTAFEQVRSKLKTLSVRFNKIEIEKPRTLRNLKKIIPSSLEEIMIEGNRIIEQCPPKFYESITECFPNPVLLAHQNRVSALKMLLPLILEQYSNDNSEAFTLSTFLTMEHDGFDEIAHELTLKYGAKRMTIRLPLNSSEFDAYDELRIEGVREYSDIIRYLKGNITIAKLAPEIRDTPFPRVGISKEELKKGCKQFLNYRKDKNPPENDARLKGILTTLGIFKSPNIPTAPSYLFPERNIILGEGQVYLMVKKRSLTAQHALIGYEYLTGYGQHVFKIAELLYYVKQDKISIKYNEDPVEFEIPNYRRSYLIGKLEAPSKKIKQMHHAIQKDVARGYPLDATYMQIRVGSSRNKKVLNCLTYIVNNIEDHLGINDLMKPFDLLPSTVVERMIAREALQEERYSRKEQIERTIDIDHSGICMRAFNRSEPDQQAFIQSGKEATEGYFIKRHLLPTQRDRDELPSLTI